MKYLFTVLFLLSIFLIGPDSSLTNNNGNNSSYSGNKFFVKTNAELKISEATGKISLNTGIASLDEKISKYKIESIKNLFRLNNGDAELFAKYGMGRIYIFNLNINFNTDGELDGRSNIEEAVNDFNKDANVEFSEPVYTGTSAGVNEYRLNKIFRQDLSGNIPNDEMFYKQWYLKNSGSVDPSSGGGYAKIGADIKMIEGWNIETGSEDVIVAILDSGIKDDHPDLRDRIWYNKNEIPNNGIDDDNNGYIDDVRGWDFAYDDKRPDDGFGHGTNIATVIAANINNAIGFAGIDGKCKVMNCKNLNNDNSGEYSWWSESIKYAVDNGARIINMSEGGDDYSKVLKTAVEYAIDKGVLITAAMMNKGDDRDYYPASYKGVFAVGATDTDDKRCRKFSWGGGSCWGSHISVVAPGNKIYGLDYENDQNYEVYWSGTSQSTAVVSGIASLLIAQNSTRTNEDLKRIIKNTSKDLVGDPREDKPGWDKYYGYGRVDSYAALTYEYNNAVKNENDVFNESENIDEGNLETDEKSGEPLFDEKVDKDGKVDKNDQDDQDEPSRAKDNKPSPAKDR